MSKPQSNTLSYRAGLLFLSVIAVVGPARLGAQSPWQNQSNPLDVNGDTYLTPDDLHTVHRGLFTVPGALPLPASPPPFYDISGDVPQPFLSPLDLLLWVTNGTTNPSLIHGPPPNALPPNAGPLQVRLVATDLLGNPVTQVSVGDDFKLSAYVLDVRSNPQGVFSLYFDLGFNQSLAAPVGSPEFGVNYSLGQNLGTPAPGAIQGLGAFSGLTTAGTTEELLFSQRLSAVAVGQLQFSGANSYGLLTLLEGPVAASFQGTSVTIVPEPACLTAIILVLAALRRRDRRHR